MKKPIYKRVWFWAIIIVIALFIAGSAGSSDDEDKKDNTPKQETQQTESQVKKEDTKEEAITADKAINGMMKAAMKQYDELNDVILQGEDMSSIYVKAEKVSDTINKLDTNIKSKWKSDTRTEYLEAASDLCLMMRGYAMDISSYAQDTTNLEAFKTAQETLNVMDSFISVYASERNNYLTKCGLSESEIAALNEES